MCTHSNAGLHMIDIVAMFFLGGEGFSWTSMQGISRLTELDVTIFTGLNVRTLPSILGLTTSLAIGETPFEGAPVIWGHRSLRDLDRYRQ